MRLAYAELAQRVHRAAMEVLGPAALVHDGWTREKRELDVVLSICGSPPS